MGRVPDAARDAVRDRGRHDHLHVRLSPSRRAAGRRLHRGPSRRAPSRPPGSGRRRRWRDTTTARRVPTALCERDDLLAPLRGAVEIGEAIAHDERRAAGVAARHRIARLAAQGNGQRLVEQRQALLDAALPDDRAPDLSESHAFDVGLPPPIDAGIALAQPPQRLPESVERLGVTGSLRERGIRPACFPSRRTVSPLGVRRGQPPVVGTPEGER
jgi:hypothetical protein